ncbi:glycosyltransferase [Vibrio sp. 1288]|uniref:glycosyltransferase n=1 Tax=Vibrio sp. 1288 TaxID=3074550 RepID=UPI00296773E6|nr:glycosyltransferase [Vibrio sp. 1288]MDW3137687.1 glycosyltransferase [Vibrio sp. 1288]
MNIIERPLVSFVLIAYNQEEYIKEAIEGALSQTYSPLEIILSDDCSRDRTFEIMREVAESYQGPHKIILNRNDPNLGIGGHINRVMSLSSGEFIVIGAGDDISLPERVSINVKTWQEKPDTKLIYSDCYFVDESGDILEIHEPGPKMQNESLDNVITRNLWCLGAVSAIHRSVFDYFGPLMDGIVHEDRAWPTRAKLLGSISYINEPLIKYQAFGGVSRDYMTKNDWLLSKSVKWYSNFINDYKQKVLDLKLSNSDYKIIQSCENKINEHCMNKAMAEGTLSIISIFSSKVSLSFKLKLILKKIKRRALLCVS